MDNNPVQAVKAAAQAKKTEGKRPRRLPARHVWEAVRELAKTAKGEVPTFQLVAILKAYYAMPKDARHQVELFCRLTGHSFDAVWTELNALWEVRKFIDDGNDGFSWATQRVPDAPLDLPPDLLPPEPQWVYLRVLRLCWLLHVFNANGREPFLLPQLKIAGWLGFGKLNKPVSLVIKWLRQNGILECVDEKYQFGVGERNKGKTYRLTGAYLSSLSSQNTKYDKDAKSPKDGMPDETKTGAIPESHVA